MSGRLGWPVLPATDLVSDQLIWFAPLVLLAGCGAAMTLMLRSAAAGSAVVGLVWLLQEAMPGFFDETPWRRMLWLFFQFHDDLAVAWYANRGLLIVCALVLLLLVHWMLSRSEHLLKEEW